MYSTNILKSMRSKRLLTQDDVAIDIKVSRQMYCTYENNLLQCELDLIFKILNSLKANNIEIEEFFNGLKQDYKSYKMIKRKEKEE